MQGRVIGDGLSQSLQLGVRAHGMLYRGTSMIRIVSVGATVQEKSLKARHVSDPHTHISNWIGMVIRKLTALQMQEINAGKRRPGRGREDREIWEAARLKLQVGQRRGKRSRNGKEWLD